MDRSGPVPAAVRAAGYQSEEEDEYEDGSSVEEEEESEAESQAEEEEEEEEEEEAVAGDHHSHHAPSHHSGAKGVPDSVADAAPSYSAPAEGSNIQMVRSTQALWLAKHVTCADVGFVLTQGESGYALEKKPGTEGAIEGDQR